ncbi:MAG: type II secretion system F family protein [Dermatophilaceae bacterium]
MRAAPAVVGLLVAGVVLLWPRAGAVRVGADPSGRDAAATRVGPAWPWPRGGRRARRRRRALEQTVLAVLDALGAGLRAGLPPEGVLRHLAATDDAAVAGLAAELVAAGSRGEQCWRRQARLAQAPEVLVVAQAWALARDAGVRLADAVELAARLLREARTRRDRREVSLAGPRATIAVLTLLPVLGPAVGLTLGVSPTTLYAGNVASIAATGAGLALVVLGRAWAHALVKRSQQAVPQSWAERARPRRGWSVQPQAASAVLRRSP